VGDDDIIAEQIDYYRKKAPEYDASAAPADSRIGTWAREIDDALDRFAPAGHVLEIACGTGLGTQRLLHHAEAVTALDSSPEVIELARKRTRGDPRVQFIVANIFEWDPPEQYDVVYFRAWITHVPLDRFDAFWDLVRRALKPDGRVFFDDDLEGAFEEEFLESHVVRRSTTFGPAHRVVKVFWKPAELEQRLNQLGWEIHVRTTGLLMWGEGGRIV
jgi:SAM-dependent methyltransferase